MICTSSLQPSLISSFFGVRFIQPVQPLHRMFGYNPGSKHVLMRLSRSLSGLTDLLFNKSRNQVDSVNSKQKRLRPGKISPRRPVPDHIPRPPYVNSRQPPGISSGSEVHDEKGIECMRASGRLAAQVLEYAGTLVKGFHGDTSATFLCGDVGEEAKNLVQVTKECLYKAIAVCAPGVEFKKIGKTIHDHADKYRYGVVRQFVGHGVGRVFHADPVILHFRNNEGGRMVLGQTFTIEPMLTIGSSNPVMWDDDWTVVTEDGSLSAQFEHTLLVTEDGAEILTQC
ncbi:methionine aminopeptidase 1D, chloroplastic/mitochondrial isoform X3 [Telopea speciosissima]|uniref:methionine aminopeptidase 1D, chloroplastic/mitochondrial isoform X3 n=1 Tax=Telopea speciosissima TaxID=54955 RepID=UPI001CC6258E|nr:methionine aminopeptidase 1D, chloroplastic/mitochondrial isoform X3 [Telopea speciosissima]